tara:strand:- start:2743 stop:3159 length:417 start_codon:yes stop_codon:yes gene_type:complete
MDFINNNNIILSRKIIEFIDFLLFSFKFKNNKKVVFNIVDDNKKSLYHLLIKINNNIIIRVDKNIECDDYDTFIRITEELLLELYCEGASITKIFKKYLKGEFKTKKFSYKKFNKFLSNFNFSQEYWNDFYIFQNNLN